jgi:hypothetical protein
MTEFRVRKLAAIALVCSLGLVNTAVAQDQFDPKKFFKELNDRGVNTKALDPDKFFRDIGNQGVSANKPMDSKKFFEELGNQGVSVQNIDAQKFWQDMANQGVKLPVEVQK